ncbi:hypothetical protein C8J57DRAFT_1473646 [Mycena rebaudengoi]|nr:hypothetical protein C8J57DRAFT_1473646 [Mycena rebaudengoi]
MATNYASILGIQNTWAPIVFAVIYFLLLLWYTAQAVRRHAWVYGALAFFSLLRVISYSLRAVMAGNHRNSAFNRKMAIAYEILYNVGFFSILLSAYRLLHSRRRLAEINQARERGRSVLHRVLGGLHKGRIIEFLLLLAVILGAVGIGEALSSNARHVGQGNMLNDASTYIFLVVTIFIALLTLLVIRLERLLIHNAPSSTGTSYRGSHHLILSAIATLLLLRMLFHAATVHQRATNGQNTISQATDGIKHTAQGNEHLWYPLSPLPELLAALLFLAPGLVPLRSLLRAHASDRAHLREKAPGAGDGASANGMHNGVGAV